jgi:hypothetical protein
MYVQIARGLVYGVPISLALWALGAWVVFG